MTTQARNWLAYRRGKRTWSFGQNGGPTQVDLRLIDCDNDSPRGTAIAQAIVDGLNTATFSTEGLPQ